MTFATYFLNLDRVPDRAAFMQDQCARAGLCDPHRISAVDGSAEDFAMSPRYHPHSWGPYWSLTRTDVAVFETHRSAWQSIVDSDRPGVVLEDDVLLSERSAAAVEALARSAEQFDLVKLDSLPGHFRFGPVTALAGCDLRPVIAVLPSAAAYLLSVNGAKALLTRSARYCDHVDDFITRPFPGYRVFQLCPAIAIQCMFADPSALQALPGDVVGSERITFSGIARDKRRGPIAYRLRKELRRAIRKTANRLVLDKSLERRGGLLGTIALADDLPPLQP